MSFFNVTNEPGSSKIRVDLRVGGQIIPLSRASFESLFADAVIAERNVRAQHIKNLGAELQGLELRRTRLIEELSKLEGLSQ